MEVLIPLPYDICPLSHLFLKDSVKLSEQVPLGWFACTHDRFCKPFVVSQF